MTPTVAEEGFRSASGGSVIAHDSRHGTKRGDLAPDIYVAPDVHRAGRRAHLGAPVPQIERRGDAEPNQPGALARRQAARQSGQGAGDEIQSRSGLRIREGFMSALAHSAGEIDEHEIAASPSDFQAERKSALGIERQGHRRLANAPPLGRLAPQQAVQLQPVHRCRRRLDGEPRQPRDLDLGELTVTAHERENQSLIVEAHAGLIGPGGDRKRRRGRLQSLLFLPRHRGALVVAVPTIAYIKNRCPPLLR